MAERSPSTRQAATGAANVAGTAGDETAPRRGPEASARQRTAPTTTDIVGDVASSLEEEDLAVAAVHARQPRERGWSSSSSSSSTTASSFAAYVESQEETRRIAAQIGIDAAARLTGTPSVRSPIGHNPRRGSAVWSVGTGSPRASTPGEAGGDFPRGRRVQAPRAISTSFEAAGEAVPVTTSGNSGAAAVDADPRQRYAAPYDYPPEALVIARDPNRAVVVGVPIVGAGASAGAAGAEEEDVEDPVEVYAQVRAAAQIAAAAEEAQRRDEMPIEELAPLVNAYRSSKHLRPVAVAELVSIGSFVSIFIFMLAMLPFPAVAYGSIRTYSPRVLAIACALAVPALLVLRVFLIVQVRHDYSSEPAQTLMLIIVVLTMIGDIYLAVGSWRLAHALLVMPPHVRARLQEGWSPTPADIDRVVRHTDGGDGDGDRQEGRTARPDDGIVDL